MKKNIQNKLNVNFQKNTDKYKVSIIIPVCNVEKYLSRCLKSVCEQTMREIQIIVVNDGSTDNSLEIIKSYANKDKRIEVIDKTNTGYGNSMNIGLSKATGEYIGIVESDDYIAKDMYESLYRRTRKGTIDIVKSNFFSVYEKDDSTFIAEPDHDRDMIPESEEPFTLKDNGQISWGHPSVWSGIYRRKFLNDNDIKFVEEKGGGWVDNPFFYETLAKAKSIIWTKKAYYYYYRGNPQSSSNKQGDPTLPFKRMIENLDILEKNGFKDDLAIRCAYARALMYLNGALQDFDYDANENTIIEYASKLMRKLDPKIMSSFNLNDQFQFYKWSSGLPKLKAKQKKVLFYNWVPFDNPWKVGGGVTVYIRNVIEQILESDPDISVYMLSSGWAYDDTKLTTFTRKINNCFGERCRQYEIVNSPVPAEQRFVFKNPTVTFSNDKLKETFCDFLKKYGPFDVIHFNNIEGISLDVFDLKKEFPDTKFIFSIHNYVPMCLTGFYYMRHKHRVCSPDHTGKDCEKCAASGRMANFSSEVYGRGKFGVVPEKCYSAKKWIKNFGLDRLDEIATADELLNFSKLAIKEINENCDAILAVSKRVYDIAEDNGFDTSKMIVSYIGTKVAEIEQEHNLTETTNLVKSTDDRTENNSFKIVFLGNDINFEEKGYPFFIESLETLDIKYAGKIDLVVTVKQKEHYELIEAFSKFKSLKIINGYTHDDLPNILSGCDLSIVPVLWEDNLPQIAIESVAYGVPVLSSSAGGASELCTSELFKFKAGDTADFLRKLCFLIDNPKQLNEYWKYHSKLVTMKNHWRELKQIFFGGSQEVANSDNEFNYILREHQFLQDQVNTYIRNGYIPPSNLTALHEEIKKLKIENQILKDSQNGDKDGIMRIAGKVIFETENNDEENSGANLLKITVPKFECSDFVAVISFVKLNNIQPSLSDQLTLSGTWLKDTADATKFYLKLHQIDWLKNDDGLRPWVFFNVIDNSVVIFVRHPGIYSGYSYIVDNITSRALTDQINIEQLSNVNICSNECKTPEAINKLDLI